VEDLILNYLLSVPLYQAVMGSVVTNSGNSVKFPSSLQVAGNFIFSIFICLWDCALPSWHKNRISRVYNGLRLLYKAEGITSLVDNDGSQQAVTFNNGRASRQLG